VLYVSTRRRAQETAEIIGDVLGLKPIVDADLDEYRHGFDPSVTMAESKKYMIEKSDPLCDWRPFRMGESVGEVFTRAARVIDRIDAAGNEVSLVVTHSMLIDKIVSYWVGLKLEDMTPFVFRSSNTSTTILSYRFGERMIERLNDTLHLGEYLCF
jgi:broad specificity phosphatase PhoE